MQVTAIKKVRVNVKKLSICVKIGGNFSADVKDEQGRIITQYEGPVPSFMPGHQFGEFLVLDIDIDTGEITNWRQPKVEEIEEFINSRDDEAGGTEVIRVASPVPVEIATPRFGNNGQKSVAT